MKKSQVSLIIIIAVVLVGSLLIFFVFKEKIILKEKQIPIEIQPVYEQLSDCIEQRAVDAIRLAGLQGGYVVLPEKYIQTDISNIAYGIYNNEKVLITKTKIENEIMNYLKTTINYCINKEDFKEFEVNQGNDESEVKIKEEFVEIKVKFPVSVKKAGYDFTLDMPHKKEIPIRLGKIYKTADMIINKQLEDLNSIDLTFLSESEFNVVSIPIDENTLVYAITDEKSKINEIPYSFMFGVRTQ